MEEDLVDKMVDVQFPHQILVNEFMSIAAPQAVIVAVLIDLRLTRP